jgi:hypothetical protein
MIAASTFLFYNALITAIFVEPDFRYFHFTMLLRFLISGLAVALVIQILRSPQLKLHPIWQLSAVSRFGAQALGKIRGHDFLAQYFGPRPGQWAITLAVPTILLFALWAHFMIGRTN